MSTLSATIGRGVTGSRPSASEAGRLYFDTTTNIAYRDNGSSWDVAIPGPLNNPMTTAGDLIVGGASGTPARLAAVAVGSVLQSAGTGTAPAWGAVVIPTITNNIVATSQTLSGNNSWVDLATAGPACTVTVGASGVVKITLTAHIGTSATGGYGDMSFVASGTNTIAAGTASKILRASGGSATNQVVDVINSASFLLTGLSTGSTTFTAKYNQEGGAGTTTWTNRELIVEVW